MKRIGARAALVFALTLTAGCGADLETHAVQGRVVLRDGDVKQLADAHLEFQRADDPRVRADGLIGPDGRFTVQTLHNGRVLTGMPAGKFRVRLLFDDEKARRGRTLPVRRQFLDFKTSGLSVTVPAGDEVTLTVSKR